MRAVPLSKVTHTDFRRSLPGRILGYGTLSLDSPGSYNGLRELTSIPKPDELYRLIMSLVSGSGSRSGQSSVADPGVDTGPMPRLIL